MAWAARLLAGLRDGGQTMAFGLHGEGAGQAERAKKRGGDREIFFFLIIFLEFSKSILNKF